MKTITIWNVSIENALKLIEIMKEEAQDALKENKFDVVEDLMYAIGRIQEDISRTDES